MWREQVVFGQEEEEETTLKYWCLWAQGKGKPLVFLYLEFRHVS
jgi:hypothetical protein